MRYQPFFASNLDELIMRVNMQMDEGWVPLGAPIRRKNGGTRKWTQFMSR